MRTDALTSAYRKATLHLCWVLFISGTPTNCNAVSCIAALTSDWGYFKVFTDLSVYSGIWNTSVFSFAISDPYLKTNKQKTPKPEELSKPWIIEFKEITVIHISLITVYCIVLSVVCYMVLLLVFLFISPDTDNSLGRDMDSIQAIQSFSGNA